MIKKKVSILRGWPSSGKSTLAKLLKVKLGAFICSTDDFFMKEGKYNFVPSLISDAHLWNKMRVLKYMFDGENVIVDNTNIIFEHILPYLELAKRFDYEVEILEPNNPDRFDVDLCFIRNKHGVPKEVIQRMKDNYEDNNIVKSKVAEYMGEK